MPKFHMSDTQWNTFSCKTSVKKVVCRKNEIPEILWMLQIKTVQLSIQMSTNEKTEILLHMEEENQNENYSLQVN
jgi:hypothetical protein